VREGLAEGREGEKASARACVHLGDMHTNGLGGREGGRERERARARAHVGDMHTNGLIFHADEHAVATGVQIWRREIPWAVTSALTHPWLRGALFTQTQTQRR